MEVTAAGPRLTERRFLQRKAIFFGRMPFCTLLSRATTVSWNLLFSVVLSPAVSVLRRSRNDKRKRNAEVLLTIHKSDA